MTSFIRELELMVLAVIAIAATSHAALASDAERWPFSATPMLNLQPLPEEAFTDPVAFCRGVLFAAQPVRSMPRGAAINIMASNGNAVCFEDGRASVEKSTTHSRPK